MNWTEFEPRRKLLHEQIVILTTPGPNEHPHSALLPRTYIASTNLSSFPPVSACRNLPDPSAPKGFARHIHYLIITFTNLSLSDGPGPAIIRCWTTRVGPQVTAINPEEGKYAQEQSSCRFCLKVPGLRHDSLQIRVGRKSLYLPGLQSLSFNALERPNRIACGRRHISRTRSRTCFR